MLIYFNTGHYSCCCYCYVLVYVGSISCSDYSSWWCLLTGCVYQLCSLYTGNNFLWQFGSHCFFLPSSLMLSEKYTVYERVPEEGCIISRYTDWACSAQPVSMFITVSEFFHTQKVILQPLGVELKGCPALVSWSTFSVAWILYFAEVWQP